MQRREDESFTEWALRHPQIGRVTASAALASSETYQDETGERFQQLFRDAEAKREAFRHGLRLTGFWCIVFGVLASAVIYKLWSMGAIVGFK